MARLSVEQSATSSTVAIASYDSTKWSLGTLIKQYNTNPDYFIGPHKVAQAKPLEESTAYQLVHLDGFAWSSRYDWVFGLENSVAASASRRITLYQYDRNTSTYSWRGFITMTLNNATAHTQRGFRVCYYTHTTGTVSASGTAVTGVSTQFQTQRIAVGARIGFGTTDPSAVTQWYYIASITNDTSLTLTLTAGTVTSGSYVIEELRPIIVSTNATVANGGVFVAKGVTFDDFTPAGTTIAASAATTDNLKLVYWLKDAAVVTNTTAAGAAIDGNTQTSFTGLTHSLYVPDVTTTKVYAYNLRSADTIASGIMTLTGANIVITGAQAFTGTLTQVNNGIVKTVSHGPGSGIKSLYFVTTTRLYRSAITSITQGNTTWQSENRTEIPPGGVNTIAASSALSQIDYDSVSDRFIVSTTNATAFKSYYTQYPTNSGDPFEYAYLNDFKVIDGSTSDSSSEPIPYNTNSTACFTICINGITHIARLGASGTIGQQSLFAIPIAAHWDFTSSTSQVAISPSISTPNNNKFARFLPSIINSIGSGYFPVPLNAIRTFYRTSGISDNTGTWTSIASSGDLSSVTGTSAIQFKFEFQTLGQCYGVPARITSFNVTYDDLSTDSHYQPSSSFSSSTNKQFAWRFSTAFNTTVPALRVRLYNAVSGGLLVDDNTASATGTFEKSTDDGSNWVAWTSADKGNDTTYLRYTPSSLADNIKVRALLTLN